ncbi:DUF1810 domain-containing protein [Pseudomonas knackmussii]|uniref:DUF1810 domain-containing protein n=1 Tax=Pseudomonas knackmussii TaxID=65741 RepID=A0ABY4KM80_9PSED|nr:DUF1810 domain-containing protein [Pseudomonas knackmussii]UPQ81659.1 DUF1810 domain-containing protein [Pseudomonas knackmussii]
MGNPHDLQRFVEAQTPVYKRALEELRAGHKQSHWMWFVFPQVAGLGSSAMAQRYAISGVDEARAYLEHPLLGPRLHACAQAMLLHRDRSVRQILGSPDDLKLRSSMTLFAAVAPEQPLFQQVLDTFFEGEADPKTMSRLQH